MNAILIFSFRTFLCVCRAFRWSGVHSSTAYWGVRIFDFNGDSTLEVFAVVSYTIQFFSDHLSRTATVTVDGYNMDFADMNGDGRSLNCAKIAGVRPGCLFSI